MKRLMILGLLAIATFAQAQFDGQDFSEENVMVKRLYTVQDGTSEDFALAKARIDSLINAGVIDSSGLISWAGTTLNSQSPSISFFPKKFVVSRKFNTTNGRNIIEYGDHIYTLFCVEDTNWVFGKKPIKGGAWTTFSFRDIPGDPIPNMGSLDQHYGGSIGIDKDGHIHAFINTYRSEPHYIVSKNPEDITRWEVRSLVGAEEGEMSYPTFQTVYSDTTLLLVYRDGSSFEGDTYINIYDPASKAWARQCQLVDGDGYNFYYSGLQCDKNDRLHVTGVWRTSPGAETAEDVTYLYSDDKGESWRQHDGTLYTLPITKATAAPVFDTPADTGLINGMGLAVDTLGRVSLMTTLNDSLGNTNYFHLYLEGGTWQTRFASTYTSGKRPDFVNHYGFGRPTLFAINNKTYAIVYNTFDTIQGKYAIQLLDITPGENVASTVLFDKDLGTMDAIRYDHWSYLHSGVLRMPLTYEPEIDITLGSKCLRVESGGYFELPISSIPLIQDGTIDISAFSSKFSFNTGDPCLNAIDLNDIVAKNYEKWIEADEHAKSSYTATQVDALLSSVNSNAQPLAMRFFERASNESAEIQYLNQVNSHLGVLLNTELSSGRAAYQDATFLFSPGALDSAKVFTLLPVDGTEDFPFSRNTQGSYVDHFGNVATADTNLPRYSFTDKDKQHPALIRENASTNLYLNSEILSTQDVATTAQSYSVSFYGTGSITFSGAYTGTLIGTGTKEKVTTTFTPSAGTVTSTVSGSVKYAQFEAGTISSTWYPTLSAAGTREADSYEFTGLQSGGWFSDTAGTFIIRINAEDVDSYLAFFKNSSGTNIFRLYYSSAIGQYRIRDFAGANWHNIGGNINDYITVAIAWNGTTMTAVVDGVDSPPYTFSSLPAIDQISFGGYGYVQLMAAFDYALTTDVLKKLTIKPVIE